MTRGSICITLLTGLTMPLLVRAAASQQDASKAPQATKPAEGPRLVKLTVHPAAAPAPALKYQLLPDLLDQAPGNASILYLSGSSLVRDDARRKLGDKINSWLGAPPKDLPREEVRKALDKHKDALRQVEIGAFREWCHWDWPARSEPYSLVLPPLSNERFLSKLLAVRIRLNIAEGNSDQVIHGLQTGFSMARHVGEGPTLIEALVGTAIARVMAEQAEAFVGTAEAPNLYWALTDLPRPFISLRRSLRYERSSFFLAFPLLRDPRKVELTPRQWERLANDVWTQLNAFSGGKAEEGAKMAFIGVQAQLLAQAKRYLLSQGWTTEQVDARPPQQVIAIHQIDRFNERKDDLFKWFAVPYWRAQQELERVERNLDRDAKQGMSDLATILLPALTRAYGHTTIFDRQIAALRSIEAVRLYAAGHEGKLPASLGDITEVPIPIDPITGEPFQYKLDDDKAVLEWAPPPGFSPKHGTRYELLIAR